MFSSRLSLNDCDHQLDRRINDGVYTFEMHSSYESNDATTIMSVFVFVLLTSKLSSCHSLSASTLFTNGLIILNENYICCYKLSVGQPCFGANGLARPE